MSLVSVRAALAALLLVAAVLVFSAVSEDSVDCSAGYRTDRIVRVGQHQIKAEEAKTLAEQQVGLGGRACIAADRGMLFKFEKPGHYSFWMKDVKFPIDIIWIDANRKVVGLEKNVEPGTYPDRFINKDQPAQYVLEIPANRADSLGLTIGSTVNF